MSQQFEVNITLSDTVKYTIALFDTLVLDEKTYRVTELKKDKLRDNYEVVAWEI